MAGDVRHSNWPRPKLGFEVEFEKIDPVQFQDVDGLESESQAIGYRHGNSPIFPPKKMPGLKQNGEVILRKGIFTGDSKFWDWYNQTLTNAAERRTVVIKSLDKEGNPARIWTLNHAWVTKLTSTDLESEANEVAVDSIELAYETLEVSAAS